MSEATFQRPFAQNKPQTQPPRGTLGAGRCSRPRPRGSPSARARAPRGAHVVSSAFKRQTAVVIQLARAYDCQPVAKQQLGHRLNDLTSGCEAELPQLGRLNGAASATGPSVGWRKSQRG